MRIRLLALVSMVICLPVVSAKSFYTLETANEQLGHGFETSLGIPLDACLNGSWVYQGGSTGKLDYSGGFDSSTMISTLTGSVKGGVNLVIFGGSVKFSIRKKVTENANSSSSVIRLNYNKGNYSFENRTLKPEILDLINTNPSAVRKKCGDSYIHNHKLGSNLYISAKLHFKSRTDYEWYQRKIKVRFAFWSKTTTKTTESEKSVENAVYSIRVVADGGLTPKLAEMTSGGPMYCKTDNMDACYEYVSQLFGYVFDDGAYANDLKPEHLKATQYDVESYEDSGHYDLAYVGGNSYPARFVQLSDRLRGYQDLVDDLLENLYAFKAVSTDVVEIAELEQNFAKRESQKADLASAGDYCQTLPSASLCEQRIESAIASVD